MDVEMLAPAIINGTIDCPKCKKLNLAHVEYCECGWANPYFSMTLEKRKEMEGLDVKARLVALDINVDLVEQAEKESLTLAENKIELARETGDWSDIPGEKIKEQKEQIFVATTASFPDRKILEYKGLARGSTVRAKHIGRDIAASIKNIVGGEIKGYTELLADGREEALDRMKIDAMNLGANAVVETRFSSSMIDVGACEIVAYGTAVLVDK